MALRWSDGFDKYGTSTDLALRYTLVDAPTWGATSGRLGGPGVSSTGAADSWYCTFETAGTMDANSRIHAAFWLKVTDFPPSACHIARFVTDQQTGGSTFVGAGIWVTAAGALQAAEHGAAATVDATSSNGVIVLNEWHHIEMKANFRDTGGVWEIWVDGVNVISFSGDNNSGTQPSSWTGFKIDPDSSSCTFVIDDLICWDESGTDFAHTQLPVLHIIETLDVDGDDSVQFTPLSSTNTSNVDDAAFHDTDTTYNESSTVGHVDRFTLENQAETPDSTLAIVVHSRARKTDAGSAVLRNRIVVGSTTSEGTDSTLTTSYTHKQDCYGKNPDTGPGTWGNTDVNSIKVGYEYQA